MFSEGKGDFYPGDEVGCFSEFVTDLNGVNHSTNLTPCNFVTAIFLLCDNRIANVCGPVMYT